MNDDACLHEALFYETVGKDEQNNLALPGTVRCLLCPHRCLIAEGRRGRCRIRKNEGGRLFAAGYGFVSALALDPVEKKPLARFHPGSYILSVGQYGCNLSCLFCQNHEISQVGIPVPDSGRDRAGVLSPESLVSSALAAVPRGNIGLAYTYNEPLTGYEFVCDTAIRIHEVGLKNVLVTNGYINPEPLTEILPYIDAMNIDLKSFRDSFYRETCGGGLDPVLDAISVSARICHVEIATLIIPGLNSSTAEIDELSAWIASVSPEIPLHLNRHHPDFRMQEPVPITREELFSLAEIAKKHLKYVYTGNI